MDATTPAWPSLSWAPASRRCAARGLRARARSHEDVHRRGPHTRPRELHELRRHEFRARAGDAGQVSRAQVGLRHRQSHLQRRSAAFRDVELGGVQPRKGAKNTKVPSRGKQRLGRFLPDRFSCQKLGFALSAPFRGHSISEFGFQRSRATGLRPEGGQKEPARGSDRRRMAAIPSASGRRPR